MFWGLVRDRHVAPWWADTARDASRPGVSAANALRTPAFVCDLVFVVA